MWFLCSSNFQEFSGVGGLTDSEDLEKEMTKVPTRTQEILASCHSLVFVDNKLVINFASKFSEPIQYYLVYQSKNNVDFVSLLLLPFGWWRGVGHWCLTYMCHICLLMLYVICFDIIVTEITLFVLTSFMYFILAIWWGFLYSIIDFLKKWVYNLEFISGK